jgi:hypothetical protein
LLSAAVIRLDKINLPVFAIGAGVIHAIGLAVLLPLLITLPGPGSYIDQHAVAIDVDVVPASPPSPNVDGDVDQTSALPAATEPAEAPDAIANVGPETAPAMPAEEQESTPAKEQPAAHAAPATKPKAKPAKVTRAPAKKLHLASVKPAKAPIRRPVKTPSKGVAPFKGSWSALLGGPTPSPSIKR